MKQDVKSEFIARQTEKMGTGNTAFAHGSTAHARNGLGDVDMMDVDELEKQRGDPNDLDGGVGGSGGEDPELIRARL